MNTLTVVTFHFIFFLQNWNWVSLCMTTCKYIINLIISIFSNQNFQMVAFNGECLTKPLFLLIFFLMHDLACLKPCQQLRWWIPKWMLECCVTKLRKFFNLSQQLKWVLGSYLFILMSCANQHVTFLCLTILPFFWWIPLHSIFLTRWRPQLFSALFIYWISLKKMLPYWYWCACAISKYGLSR